jgi:hypothetical protein
MTTLIRVLVISLAYFSASLAVGCILSVWLFFAIRFSSGELLHIPDSRELKGFIGSIVVSSEFVALLGLGPALPAIVYSEKRNVWSFWFYAYGGALIGLLSFAIYSIALALPEPTQVLLRLLHSFDFPAWGMWLLTTLSGFVGGAVYWLIAGRNAGLRRVGAPSQPS